jgi:1-acyl-sn-glycerol-3-phosphate acyltransferase
MQCLGSIVFTLFMAVWTISFGFVYCVVCLFLPWRGRFWMAGMLTLPGVLRAAGDLRLTYTVEGRENLPPGNHVLFLKHSSTWETYGIMILFPPLVWVMKREIYWIPFVGWGCMLAKCIAIDRKAGTAAVNQVLAQGKDRMERSVPGSRCSRKGTRMAPGETRRYGSSGTLLAAQEGCKIVPWRTTQGTSGRARAC